MFENSVNEIDVNGALAGDAPAGRQEVGPPEVPKQGPVAVSSDQGK